ncbi:hypothetical protein TRIP_C60396 [Candidatus Zixiibacteriota bacterium]|nr:hypothetical protein TRIP_C60396 [candidate division Zixibacteria bacterium]
MKIQGGFLWLLFCVVLGGAALAQNPFTIRADISGPGVYLDGSIKTINPGAHIFVDIYATNGPGGIERTALSMPFTFSGSGGVAHAIFGDTSLYPQPVFKAYWDLFSLGHVESWDGNLPNMYCYVGVGVSHGFPINSGEIKMLSIDIVINDTLGNLCIDSGGNQDIVYSWLFDDPVPGFTKTCWPVKNNPNQAPTFTNCIRSLSGSHGHLMTYTFQAADLENDTIKYQIVSGPGTIDSLSGLWSYVPHCSEVGQTISLDIAATDRFHSATGPMTEHCTPDINVYNSAPVISGPCGATLQAGGYTAQANFIVNDSNPGDIFNWEIADVNPSPAGTYFIDSTGHLSFTPQLPADQGIDFDFTVRVSDCAGDSSSCEVTFAVTDRLPFGINIGFLEVMHQGRNVQVPVIKNSGTEEIWGFDFLIAYNALALSFSGAEPGVLYQNPGPYEWEYFSARFGPSVNCGDNCPSGLIRVAGIADMNDGIHHPLTKLVPDNTVIFNMNFMVSESPVWECMYLPIQFYWADCGDNLLAFRNRGDTLAFNIGTALSSRVFDFDGEITNPQGTFPTYTGALNECLQGGTSGPPPLRFIDFHNGGIGIICPDSTVTVGDINLNGIAYEVADAVIFTNFFIYGRQALAINPEMQAAQSDINLDGEALTLEDYVYMLRIIFGTMSPGAPIDPAFTGTLTFVETDSSIIVRSKFDLPVGAVHLCFYAPELQNYDIGGDVKSALSHDSLKVLLTDSIGTAERTLFEIACKGPLPELAYCAAAGYFGEKVTVAKLFEHPTDIPVTGDSPLPISFALEQNRPNPFNPVTEIRFALPTRTDWRLDIYNIAGQKVQGFSGSDGAGYKTIRWDGTDDNGTTLPTGIYFYRLTAGDFTASKKMLLLK